MNCRFGALPAWAQLRIATAPHWQLDLGLDGILDAESLTALTALRALSPIDPRVTARQTMRGSIIAPAKGEQSLRSGRRNPGHGRQSLAGADAPNGGGSWNDHRGWRMRNLMSSPGTWYSPMTKRPQPRQLNAVCP